MQPIVRATHELYRYSERGSVATKKDIHIAEPTTVGLAVGGIACLLVWAFSHTRDTLL